MTKGLLPCKSTKGNDSMSKQVLVKILMLTQLNGPDLNLNKGKQYPVSKELAEELIKAGAAKVVGEVREEQPEAEGGKINLNADAPKPKRQRRKKVEQAPEADDTQAPGDIYYVDIDAEAE